MCQLIHSTSRIRPHHFENLIANSYLLHHTLLLCSDKSLTSPLRGGVRVKLCYQNLVDCIQLVSLVSGSILVT